MRGIMGGPTQGPPNARPSREVLVRKTKVDMRSAVWEASQFLSDDEIREYVEATLREIESDRP